jgi:hypothetical protein
MRPGTAPTCLHQHTPPPQVHLPLTTVSIYLRPVRPRYRCKLMYTNIHLRISMYTNIYITVYQYQLTYTMLYASTKTVTRQYPHKGRVGGSTEKGIPRPSPHARKIGPILPIPSNPSNESTLTISSHTGRNSPISAQFARCPPSMAGIQSRAGPSAPSAPSQSPIRQTRAAPSAQPVAAP